MPHEICAATDDGVEMLDLLQSVVAEHARGCWGTTKAADTFEAEMPLEMQTSIFEEAAI